VQEQDLLTGDDDSERKARLTENRGVDAQGLVWWYHNSSDWFAACMMGLHILHPDTDNFWLQVVCTSSVLVWRPLREQLESSQASLLQWIP